MIICHGWHNKHTQYFIGDAMKTYTSIEQIKQDIDNGTKVYWMHKGYIVIKDSLGEYGILCTMNDNYVGIQSAQNPKAYFAE